MKMVTVTFFILSAILFLGTIKFLFELKRPGVYPPKQVVKKRAAALAGGGGICLLLAFLLSNFS
ncbi:hypothetical protein [Neobacillus jeddahensis]|uniref:hypothetical protein n=1 Tax=Neobacillus jeddahensis TaxID=1461580 RepID=UPI0005903C38|nr:hypothetical protein [Neobacillus jeddahensis]